MRYLITAGLRPHLPHSRAFQATSWPGPESHSRSRHTLPSLSQIRGRTPELTNRQPEAAHTRLDRWENGTTPKQSLPRQAIPNTAVIRGSEPTADMLTNTEIDVPGINNGLEYTVSRKN